MNPDECYLVVNKSADAQIREYEGKASAPSLYSVPWLLPLLRRATPCDERVGRTGRYVVYRWRDIQRGRAGLAEVCYATHSDGSPRLQQPRAGDDRPRLRLAFLTDFQPDPTPAA